MRLAHLDAFDPLPPAMLYRELIGLLGRLSVLPGVDDELADRQFGYRHDDLQGSFEPLAATLRHALARVIETPVLPLRFEDRGDQVYICVVDKQWNLKKLVFAVSAAMPADKLRQLLPQQTKLGAVEQIQKLVDLQLPGARLIPLSNPPARSPFSPKHVLRGRIDRSVLDADDGRLGDGAAHRRRFPGPALRSLGIEGRQGGVIPDMKGY